MSQPNLPKVEPGEKAVVLLSGGLDSATLLAYASRAGYEVYCLSFDYGQHAVAELEGARQLAMDWGAKQHVVVPVGLNQFGGTALVGEREVPVAGQAHMEHGIPETYVPARNTVFLAMGLGWAEALHAYTVFIGANSVDYSGYPDCRPEYIDAYNNLARLAVAEGSAGGRQIQILAPLMDLSKGDIVRLGTSLGVDYSKSLSCYNAAPDGRACGVCDSCALRLQGFKDAGLEDPAPYVDSKGDGRDPWTMRLDVARKLARKAGACLRGFYGQLEGYQNKGEVDLVTQADKAAEAVILAGLAEHFPTDSVLAEESGAEEGTSQYRWIIDPLDGTTNFVHSQPQFAVSIAVETEGERVIGVIYLPYFDEMYYAVKGRGAKGPDGPLKVTQTQEMNHSLLATGFPYSRRETIETILEDVRRAILNGQGVRRTGAAAVDLAYLACGRYDGFWERELKPWDMAAGEVLVREAGGTLTNFQGGEFSPYVGEIAGSNGLIHKQLLASLFEGR